MKENEFSGRGGSWLFSILTASCSKRDKEIATWFRDIGIRVLASTKNKTCMTKNQK